MSGLKMKSAKKWQKSCYISNAVPSIDVHTKIMDHIDAFAPLPLFRLLTHFILGKVYLLSFILLDSPNKAQISRIKHFY